MEKTGNQYLLHSARHPNESQADYLERQRTTAAATKKYRRGRVVISMVKRRGEEK
jgi:hypothetical protein